jgi:hypothetical protein
MFTKFCSMTHNEREQGLLEDLKVDKMSLKWILQKYSVNGWSGSI